MSISLQARNPLYIPYATAPRAAPLKITFSRNNVEAGSSGPKPDGGRPDMLLEDLGTYWMPHTTDMEI
jgi:hypothetical protein